jgi:PhoPQ-activated pathogenicity-related protein
MFALVSLGLLAAAAAAPLDDYVWRPDSHYAWQDLGETHILKGCNIIKTNCWTGYMLNMTSQKWLNEEDYAPNSRTKSIWYHSLLVIVPDNIRHYRNASLWITGGNINGLPSASDEGG